MGNYPFKYVEETMHHRRLSNKDRKVVKERLKNLNNWKGKMLTIAGLSSPHKALTI
jgi:hypothetical protein